METREIIDTLSKSVDGVGELWHAFELETIINNHDSASHTTLKLDKKIKKNLCYQYDCNKKLGLIPFECRCKGKFCAKHRYNYTHDCTFDYKTYHNKILTEQNPVVTSSKIIHIWPRNAKIHLKYLYLFKMVYIKQNYFFNELAHLFSISREDYWAMV